jgi:hypothetical protein
MNRLVKTALLGAALGMALGTLPVFADSESGGVFYGGGDSEANPVLWGNNSESGGAAQEWGLTSESGGSRQEWNLRSQSGGPYDSGTESESGGVRRTGAESESGGVVLWGSRAAW